MEIRRYMPTVAAAAVIISAATPIALSHSAFAQGNPTRSNVIPESETATINAKITAINPKTRAVTLVGASGHKVTVIAGPVVRLSMLKVGDTVNAKYYRSVAFLLKPPQGGSSAPMSDDEMRQMTTQPAQAPGGVGVRVTKVSGTVVGIDMAAHSVDVVNPSGGGVVTLDVTDPERIAMLGSLKVGDTITAVISEAMAVSIEPARKRWF